MKDSKGIDCKLHIIEGDEAKVPKGSLEVDVRFFDLDSLVRLYGKDRVRRYFERSMPKDTVNKMLEVT